MARVAKKVLPPVKVPKTKAIKKPAGKKAEAALPAFPPPVAVPLSRQASKKDPVPPVLAKRASSKKANGKTLDLCLLMDCTGSMASWIERSKNTLKEIIDNVKNDNPDLDVRVCFVGYRDIQDGNRFSIHEFTDDLDKVKKFISSVTANGGGDTPEDVQGGFHQAF